LPLDRSAAVAVGLAGTAMPFAGSPEAEAERWLRILRVHGDASVILSSVGVTEAPQAEPEHDSGPPAEGRGDTEQDVLARVTDVARRRAGERGADAVDTSDLLMAVTRVYGDAFDHALRAHGSSRQEVLAVLEAQ
jgi:hypothetical protein